MAGKRQPLKPSENTSRPRARGQDVDLTTALLILAGTMFMVPVIILIPTKLLTGDIPGMMLKTGLWSMAFSLTVAAIGVFIGWAEGQRRR